MILLYLKAGHVITMVAWFAALFFLGRMLLDGFDNVADKPIDDMICKPDYSYQTHAYMLSKKGVRKLVENHLPMYKSMLFPVDELLPSLYCKTPRTCLLYTSPSPRD